MQMADGRWGLFSLGYALGIAAASPFHKEGASVLMIGRSSVNEPVRSTDRAISKLSDATA